MISKTRLLKWLAKVSDTLTKDNFNYTSEQLKDIFEVLAGKIVKAKNDTDE